MSETPYRLMYRANTPEQKREVIERLLTLWLEQPELRLGQLIMNTTHNIYYIEDFDLLDNLEHRWQVEKEMRSNIQKRGIHYHEI